MARYGVMVVRQGNFFQDLSQAQVLFDNSDNLNLRGQTAAEIYVAPGEHPDQPVAGFVIAEDSRIPRGRLRLVTADLETG